MSTETILIVDDEKEIIETVSSFLGDRGFSTKTCVDAAGLFESLKEEISDLIILDLKLPDMHGFEVCKLLKQEEKFSQIPIIILSGLGDTDDKVVGLDLGAEDYVVKPFSLEELVARIKAVLRRHNSQEGSDKININNIIEIDLERYTVKVYGKEIYLTPAEFKILELLASRKGQVFTRDRILDHLWGKEKIVVSRTVDVHIRHLREKLGNAEHLIKNVRGIGYKIEDD